MDLTTLAGQELHAVEFVDDFLQLRFSEASLLTLYEWPSIVLAEYAVSFGEPEYRNQLCALLGEEVERAEHDEGATLTLHFTNATVLALSLREEDLSGPEAGTFSETGNPADTEEF